MLCTEKAYSFITRQVKSMCTAKNYNTRMVDGMNQGIECLKETVLKCTGPKQPPPRFRQAQN